jgi:allophanate hydrolase subunit 1
MKTKQFMQPVEIMAPGDQSVPCVAQSVKAKPLAIQEALPSKDSLQIKAAEYWLKLGEADQALKELEALPSRSWKCGWALRCGFR